MKRWTGIRIAACRRDEKGRFKVWIGGKSKSQLKKKRNSYHGIATHIGKEFIRQHGRAAKVGECVRKKTKSGTYHKGADWYVRTPNGWRDTGSPAKPNKSRIKAIIKASRPGR